MNPTYINCRRAPTIRGAAAIRLIPGDLAWAKATCGSGCEKDSAWHLQLDYGNAAMPRNVRVLFRPAEKCRRGVSAYRRVRVSFERTLEIGEMLTGFYITG